MRFRTILTSLTATTVAATMALGVGAAGAGPVLGCTGNASNAPDGKIKVLGGPFVGGGTYPNEHVDVTPVAPGASATFVMKWKNTTAATKTITVNRGFGSVSPGTSTKFFVNGVNVTQQVKAGKSFTVAPGKRTPSIQMVITNKAGGDDFASTELHGRYANTVPCDALQGSING